MTEADVQKMQCLFAARLIRMAVSEMPTGGVPLGFLVDDLACYLTDLASDSPKRADGAVSQLAERLELALTDLRLRAKAV